MLSRGSRLAFRSFRALSTVPSGAFLPASEVTTRVINVVKSTSRSCPEDLSDDANFTQLGFDSLIRKELWSNLEEEFCVQVPSNDAESFLSIASVSKYFASHPKAR